MKKFSLLGIAAIAGLALVGCTNNGDKVETKDVYTLNKEEKVAKVSTCEILFKNGSDVPYISLDEGTALMSQIRQTQLDDKKYKYELTKGSEEHVIKNETGAKCTINKEKQTLTYSDYDAFINMVPETQKPLSIVPLKKDYKALKVISQDYVQGKEFIVELNKYPKLDVYSYGDRFYLPLSVYNSVLLNAEGNVSLAYNGKNMFVIPTGSLQTTELLPIPILTELGTKFREDAAKEALTQEEVEYYYQSLLFDFDYLYGLRDKFSSFEQFLISQNQKSNFDRKDPRSLDSATAIALTWLNDGHTALSELSNLYEFLDNNIDKSLGSQTLINLENRNTAFATTKQQAKITDGIEYKGNTAFVTFTKFTNVNHELLYDLPKADELEDDITGIDDTIGFDFDSLEDVLMLSNTGVLFNKLYKELTIGEHKNDVKNIVIDLTTNEGGAADGLLYALSTLIGNVQVNLANSLTGASNVQVYKADMNGDGAVDEKDKSLKDLGFKIYFLDSAYSFSSANAMPYLAKLNCPSVVTLGDKTAGGPCAVRSNLTTIGSVICSSSLNTICKKVNDKFVNIDDGIKADYPLTEAQMIDRDYIVSNIANWTSK